MYYPTYKQKYLSSPGFTLLELLVTLAIISILSLLAYPSYRHYQLRAKRLEAHITLLDLAHRMEQYAMENHGEYTHATLSKLGVIAQSTGYQLNILQANSQSYLLRATPYFKDSACKNLSYNHLGEYFSEGSAPTAKCWGRE